jgi:hypothetical protein
MNRTLRQSLLLALIVLSLTTSRQPLAAQATPGIAATPTVWEVALPAGATGLAVDATTVYVGGIGFFHTYGKDGTAISQRTTGILELRVSVVETAVYIGGTFAFGSKYYGYVRKEDTAGNVLWAKLIGASNESWEPRGRALAADATGVYVGGDTWGDLAAPSEGQRDAFVRAYDTDGGVLWTRQFGSSLDDTVNGIALDETAVYVVGDSWTQAGLVAFVRRYDRNGTLIWTDESISGSAMAVSVDTTGIYVGGHGYASGKGFLRKYDTDGGELWTREFELYSEASAVAANGTGVWVAGITGFAVPGYTSSGSVDVVARKYDLHGNEIWTYQFGTSSSDYGQAIAVDGTGVYVSGVGGTGAGFLVKLSEPKMIAAGIERLMTIVGQLNLEPGLANGLYSKLLNVKASLAAKNAGIRRDAVNKLQAFINQCKAQKGKAIADSDADLLIEIAKGVIAMIQQQ